VTETHDDLRGIQEVATSLGVTPRTLRLYEDHGLIAPRRVGKARIYTRRETARMTLILRGKRLGFTLRDIKEFLDLYDADPQHIEQMATLAERCRGRIDELIAQREALTTTLVELEAIEQQALAAIAERQAKHVIA
jgi:DNA-binding transcriptional MerR regulator